MTKTLMPSDERDSSISLRDGRSGGRQRKGCGSGLLKLAGKRLRKWVDDSKGLRCIGKRRLVMEAITYA